MSDDWKDDWRLAFPTDYIGAAHLRGRDVTLTISAVSRPELHVVSKKDAKEATQKKLVIAFKELENRPQGEPRMMVVNKTNAKTISELYGKAARQWIGKQITLYPTTCRAFGKMEDCIRVRDEVPKPKRQPKQSEPEVQP